MNYRHESTPIYKGRGDSLKLVDPSMNHRRVSTPIHKGSGDRLGGGEYLGGERKYAMGRLGMGKVVTHVCTSTTTDKGMQRKGMPPPHTGM